MEEVKRGFQKKTIKQNIEYKMIQWIKTISTAEAEEATKGDFEKTENSMGATENGSETKINTKKGSEEPETNELGLTVEQQRIYDAVVVTGGSIASMLDGDLPNDYDVYFTDMDVAQEVGEHYLKILLKKGYHNYRIPSEPLVRKRVDEEGVEVFIKSAGVMSDKVNLDEYLYFECSPEIALKKYMKKFDHVNDEDNKGKFRPVFISSNAITLTDGVQLILRFCGDADTIHTNFDYIHTMNYWTAATGVVLNLDSVEAIMSKTLKYVGSKYPICTLFRMRKFIKRGWSISAGEVLKISYDVSKLDLDNLGELRDQLIGVDSAYFIEVIQALQDAKQADVDIDRTYLFEIVNRIFQE